MEREIVKGNTISNNYGLKKTIGKFDFWFLSGKSFSSDLSERAFSLLS